MQLSRITGREAPWESNGFSMEQFRKIQTWFPFSPQSPFTLAFSPR
jgi:hypothetical protein